MRYERDNSCCVTALYIVAVMGMFAAVVCCAVGRQLFCVNKHTENSGARSEVSFGIENWDHFASQYKIKWFYSRYVSFTLLCVSYLLLFCLCCWRDRHSRVKLLVGVMIILSIAFCLEAYAAASFGDPESFEELYNVERMEQWKFDNGGKAPTVNATYDLLLDKDTRCVVFSWCLSAMLAGMVTILCGIMLCLGHSAPLQQVTREVMPASYRSVYPVNMGVNEVAVAPGYTGDSVMYALPPAPVSSS